MIKLLLSLFVSSALAQDIPNHSVPVGGGPGFIGFRSIGPCTANQIMAWAGGVGVDPTCSGTLPSGLTGYALTKTDDTNVTLTLGGSPSTALVNASSLTLGWTGTLSVPRGGTGLASGTSGGVPYFNSTTTIASSALLATDNIIFGAGAGNAPATGRCTMDTNQSIVCSSATSLFPSPSVTNSTADANSASITIQKNRTGGNTNSGDVLALLQASGFANTAQRVAVQAVARQAAASSGSNIPSALDLKTSNASGLLNQVWSIDNNAHIKVTASVAPTLTAGCNGAGSSVSGNDTHGTATGQTAAATTCTLTFAVAYAATPDCVVSGQSSPLTGAFTPSTATLVVNFASTANYKFTWHCYGQ